MNLEARTDSLASNVQPHLWPSRRQTCSPSILIRKCADNFFGFYFFFIIPKWLLFLWFICWQTQERYRIINTIHIHAICWCDTDSRPRSPRYAYLRSRTANGEDNVTGSTNACLFDPHRWACDWDHSSSDTSLSICSLFRHIDNAVGNLFSWKEL